MELLEQANNVFLSKHKPETWFERALFFSWFCEIRDCKFCYMSAAKHKPTAKRSITSLIAEAILCKELGWRFGFLSGGIGAYKRESFLHILKLLNQVTGEKLWLNIGALDRQTLMLYKPYTKGVVASVETINQELHKKLCPSKPLKPYEDMLRRALRLNLRTAMTIIIGLGETKQDYTLLKQFIKRYNISKIHFYCLNPQKGTIFENKQAPTPDEQAWWIAKTRMDFPKMDIQAGIWLDKVSRVGLLLRAGANSISKFPAIRYFGSPQAYEIEQQALATGRKFLGTLTEPIAQSTDILIHEYKIEKSIIQEVKDKLERYLSKIQNT